jgi:DnaJ-class molecular chaperone
MTNYYEILGINADADADTIKRAYRSLASKHHPDKGGDTARFQEIQTAYDTLSDPERRSQYDHQLRNPFNHEQFHFNHRDFENSDPLEQFKTMFGFGGGSPDFFAQRKNRNVRIAVDVTLEETLSESFRILDIASGPEKKSIRIDIPAGVQNHQLLKYSKMGIQTHPNLPPGDLLVEIIFCQHPKFGVISNDLILHHAIDCFDAIIGCDVRITGLDQKELEFTVRPGTQPGTKYKLKGQGLRKFRAQDRGDLIVIIDLTVPQLDKNQLELVQQLKKTLNEN